MYLTDTRKVIGWLFLKPREIYDLRFLVIVRLKTKSQKSVVLQHGRKYEKHT